MSCLSLSICFDPHTCKVIVLLGPDKTQRTCGCYPGSVRVSNVYMHEVVVWGREVSPTEQGWRVYLRLLRTGPTTMAEAR